MFPPWKPVCPSVRKNKKRPRLTGTFWCSDSEILRLKQTVLNIPEVEHDHLDDHVLNLLDVVDIVLEHHEQSLDETGGHDLQEVILENPGIVFFDLGYDQSFQLGFYLMVMGSVAVEDHDEDFLRKGTEDIHHIGDDRCGFFLVFDVRDVKFLVKRFQVVDGFLRRQQHRLKQRFLIFKITVNVSHRDSRAVRDPPHVGVLVAPFEELVDGPVQNRFLDRFF